MKSKPHPRKMWANYHDEGYVFLYSIKSHCMNSAAEHIAVPVAVIPLDDLYALGDSMVSALAAIGVLPRQRKGGAK